MDKTLVKIMIFSILAAMITIPVLINGLMFINIFPVSGDEKTWISSLGTFWGAIIGGVISGTLTLIGVVLTIKASFDALNKTLKHQEKERFKETIGIKLNKLYEVKSIVYKLDRLLGNRKKLWNEQFEKEESKTIEDSILEYLLPNFNYLLEISSAVDWEFHFVIKAFVTNARSTIYENNNPDFESLTNIANQLAIDIEKIHEKRLSDQYKFVST